MKFIDTIRTASANMFRSKLRSFLTIIAIFIGAFTLSLTNGIGAGISTYIDKQLGNLGASDMLIIEPKSENPFGNSGPQKYDPERSVSSGLNGITQTVLTQQDLDIIQAQPGIISVQPNLNAVADYIEGNNQEKYQLMLSPVLTGTNLDMAAGSSPNNNAAQNEIVLPLSYVAPLGFSSNDDALNQTVTIAITDALGTQHTVQATVVGVQNQTLISSAGAGINQTLLTTLYNLQSTGLPEVAKSRYGIAEARVKQDISADELTSIKNELGQKGYTATTVEDQIGIIKQVIDAILAVLSGFAAIALLAASFGIINTLLMAVQERTKEIGLMKAMGMSSKKVFLLFSTEAVLLGFWGSLLGTLAANGVGQIINRVASNTFLKDLSGFELTSFPLLSTVTIMLVIMAIAFLAGTLPARRASKQNPIDALRYE